MKLSVVIVNYNVQYFLEQALLSAEKAMEGIQGEIFVVDNNSIDDSVGMVREKFPKVKLIRNHSNPGFSKANNQAIKQASGEYILLLNPDTVVEEDTFQICTRFMDDHPEAGALGVKMIDGSGNFLPESKRGLPTPWVAFCKMFGLSWLFPKSRLFNRYHLGFLKENKTHEIEILAGAFMFMRKSVLDSVGYLDETFFMYGEDIDLSYRIKKAGHKVYYHPATQIIHYKGESTKKGSLNYVLTFYNAMIIFARKHFSQRQANLFTLLIRVAIFFRGFLTLVGNGMKKLIWPLIDFILVFSGLFLLKNVWANFYFNDPNYYPEYVNYIVLPLYSLLWVLSILFNGGYDKPLRIGPLVRGILVGTLLLAAIYAFLSLEYRPSRILILLGTFWSITVLPIFRMMRNIIDHGRFRSKKEAQERVAVIGSAAEFLRTNLLLDKAGVEKNMIGRIAVSKDPEDSYSLLGSINQLQDIVRIHKVEELIFCSLDISAQMIMELMTKIGNQVKFKILPKESESIIGSSSKNVAGELYTIDIQYQIQTPAAKRNKRLFDVLMSLVLVVLGPVMALFSKSIFEYFKNVISSLFGLRTLVGYHKYPQPKLPKIKKGILSPLMVNPEVQVPTEDSRLDFFYARDYSVNKDFEILWKGWKHLGNKS